MTKTADKSPKITAAGQVLVLKSLSQRAASYLVGMDGRAMRDIHDMPRNGDDTYDARALLRWSRDRIPDPKLTDDDFERMLLVGEEFMDAFGGTLPAIITFIEDLQDRYGDLGLTFFARTMLTAFRVNIRVFTEEHLEPSNANIQRDSEKYVAARRESIARDRLEIAVVCEFCTSSATALSGKKERPRRAT